MRRRSRLMQDETSEEGQRYIAEQIERQNIEFMQEFAMEHMPGLLLDDLLFIC